MFHRYFLLLIIHCAFANVILLTERVTERHRKRVIKRKTERDRATDRQRQTERDRERSRWLFKIEIAVRVQVRSNERSAKYHRRCFYYFALPPIVILGRSSMGWTCVLRLEPKSRQHDLFGLMPRLALRFGLIVR